MRDPLMREADTAQARHVVGDPLAESFEYNVNLETGTGTYESRGNVPVRAEEAYVNRYNGTVSDERVLAHMLSAE